MTEKIKRYLTDAVTCPTCDSKPGKPCIAPLSRIRRLRMQRDDPSTAPPTMVEVGWLHHTRKAA